MEINTCHVMGKYIKLAFYYFGTHCNIHMASYFQPKSVPYVTSHGSLFLLSRFQLMIFSFSLSVIGQSFIVKMKK